MIAVVWSFLKQSWLYTGLAGLLTVFCVQHLEIGHLKRESRQYQAEALTLENSNKALVESLENQNAAINAMQALSQAKAKQAAIALTAAKAKAKQYALRAQRIEAQQSAGDSCADIRALVNGFIK